MAMHSYSHNYDQIYANVGAFSKDLMKLQKYLYDLTDVKPYIYRFPGGSSNHCAKNIKPYIRYVNKKGLLYFDWNALNEDAAKKIYAAKGRPSDNPLIIHITNMKALEKIVSEVPEKAVKVAEKYWPGPLTMIFNKSDIVPYGTTGGLDTVAVRMPVDAIAREVIDAGGGYIAAPSANTSGRPSPTTAQHVAEDLTGRVDMIVDGGAVEIGVESTILDMTVEPPMILRPGAITKEMFEKVIGEVTIDRTLIRPDSRQVPKAPGMKYRHYAPKGQLTLVEGDRDKVIARINELVKEKEEEGHKVGVIGTDETLDSYHADILRSIGSRQKPETVAANLYRILREFDDLECDYMYSESFFEQGLGNAIMNRMLKAAGYHLITL